MDICFLLETREPLRPNEIIVEVGKLLMKRGERVRMIYPEQELWNLDKLKPEADIYLLKSDSELALNLAQSFELMGAKVLNPFNACRNAKDKTVAAGLLLAAGIPTPASFAAAKPYQFETMLADGPIILKHNRGYHGAGIAVVDTHVALTRAPDYAGMVFAQSYLADARKDLKLFGIGEEVFAVRKPFSVDSYKHGGTAVELDQDLAGLARRCAKTFGLSLYGIDIAETADGPSVVDVNYFPGYRSVPRAAERLSDFIWHSCRGLS
jgi:ribosomal protein S6--L-glutamate ligase